MNIKHGVILAAGLMSAVVWSAEEPGSVRANWFEAVISPEIGSLIAGYGDDEVSAGKHDDLLATGLCVDDGTNRVMLVSLDLIGLDYKAIKEIRRRLSAVAQVPEGGILVSCTHTHQGPFTTMYSKANGIADEKTIDETPGSADMKYMDLLYARIERAAREMMKREWKICKVGYYSQCCDENRNRRYTTSENRASFNAHRPFLHRISDGVADKELGTVMLLDDRTGVPVYVIGNYAAHALTAHSPGYGGVRISSDFPGFYRRYIESETGAKAMYVQGAAGDLVTKDDECGLAAARRVGENLAMASLVGIVSTQRCYERYVIARPRVGWELRSFTSRLREKWRKISGSDTQTFDIQCVAIGDVCFVGVPGEVVCELGLEIKWNSPFARTYIAFLATGYHGYITPANLMAAGGYEPHSHRFASRDTLALVKTASDAMFDLRARLFPEDNRDADPYPDNVNAPVVNVPAMYKGSKKEH